MRHARAIDLLLVLLYVAMASLARRVSPLLHWLRSSGGECTGVTVGGCAELSAEPRSSSSLGLLATHDTVAGERLVLLPASCQLTYSSASLPRKLQRLMHAVPEQLWAARLGLVLLQHRLMREDSHFAAYVELLPQRFSSPLFWPASAIEALQYPPLSEQVKRRCRFLARFASVELASADFSGARVDADALGWALSSCSSRAFRLRGPAAPPALLPLIDLCDHSFTPNCEVALAPNGACALVALRPIAATEPLLLSYGRLGNDFLLLDYGFVDTRNEYDAVALRFSEALLHLAREVAGLGDAPFGSGTADAEPAQWQRELMGHLALEAQPELLLGVSGGTDARLLAALRLLYCAGAEPPAALRGPPAEAVALLQQPCAAALLGTTVERRMLISAAALAAIALAQFPTTLAQDEELMLRSENMEECMRLALQFRHSKKRCLKKLIVELKARAGALPLL
jgi:histone-lysine N-methyltransferase SETD3